MPTYHVDASTTAPPSAVWALLVDSRTWPTWGPLDELVAARSELRADGSRELGGVHAFRVGDNVDGERLTELVPERRMSYEAAWNASLQDYSAVIELAPEGGGTRITWQGAYRTTPELEAVLPTFLEDFMQQMADGLAAHAARTAPTA